MPKTPTLAIEMQKRRIGCVRLSVWASLALTCGCEEEDSGPGPSPDQAVPQAGEGEASGEDVGEGEGEGQGQGTPGPPCPEGRDPLECSVPAGEVLVLNGLGDPVVEAYVLAGGEPQSDWLLTDADGRSPMPALGDPRNDAYVTVAKTGFWSGGGRRPEDDAGMLVKLRALPDSTETDYEFGLAGSADDMGGTDRCMHCHSTIGAQWNGSAHRRALTNPVTLDLYDAAVAAGAQSAQTCGDCHGVVLAAPAGRPEGGFDLRTPPAGPAALADEGVTCDVCHKIVDVTLDPARPGLAGSLSLLLPSIPSTSPVSAYEPIQFGPHGDVLNPFMGGAFQPQFRESVLCAGCHSLHQPALTHPERWPDGLPLLQTWQEWAAGPMAQGPTCQGCHMPPLDEESGVGIVTADGWAGDTSVGLVRPYGEVRRHDWPAVAELGPDAVTLSLTLDLPDDPDDREVVATVRLTNAGAGHALPTGEPLRQVAVLVTSNEAPISGSAIPAVGGFAAMATLGADATLTDRSLVVRGPDPLPADAAVVRFVRPTGGWDDYEGPGVGWFSDPDRTPEDKGIPTSDVVAELGVVAVTGDTLTLAESPVLPAMQEGDIVYVVTDVVRQWAGAPGWLWSKVLADDQGRTPVHHGQAADIASDNRLAPGASGVVILRFARPVPAAGPLAVNARVVHRKRPAALAARYEWPDEDVDLATAEAVLAP